MCPYEWALPTPQTFVTVRSTQESSHLISNCESQRLSVGMQSTSSSLNSRMGPPNWVCY